MARGNAHSSMRDAAFSRAFLDGLIASLRRLQARPRLRCRLGVLLCLTGLAAGVPAAPLAGGGQSRPPGASRPWDPSPAPGGGGMCLAPGTGTCGSGPGKLGRGAEGPSLFVGNPIHLATGNKLQEETDLAPLPGPLGLELVRRYNSRHGYQGLFGVGWRMSYEVVAYATATSVQIVQADGRRTIFSRSADDPSRCASPRPSDGTVRETATGYAWRWPDGRVLQFAKSGRLEQILEPDGAFVDLQYDPRGHLLQVTDPRGRALRFHYRRDATGQRLLVERLDTPIGSFRYAYDARNNLIAVTRPSDPGVAEGATVTRRYLYEAERNGGDPHNLTGIVLETVDAKGRARSERLSTYTYDREDRAVRSEQAGGVNLVALEFRPRRFDAKGRTAPGETVLTNSRGERTRITWDQVADDYVLLESQGPGCATCPPAGRYRYDDRGLLLEKTEDGATTRYVRDERGRITAIHRRERSSATDTLVERRRYEGDRALPSRIERPSVVPGRTLSIDIVYGDTAATRDRPVRITEQGYAPAPDGVGPPVPLSRTTQYRYDARGRLLAVDGPLPGEGDLTRFTYDERGRVSAIELPGYRRVRYAYDGLGHLAAVTCPGGIEERFVHGTAGELLRATHAGQTEHYWYDARGRLAQTLSATGQRLFLHYDAAGRVAEVLDAQNNRVRLARDGEGQLLEETLLNPDGSVAQRRSGGTEVVGNDLMPTRRIFEAAGLPATAGPPTMVGAGPAPTALSIDAFARLNVASDARRHRTGYRYDDFGRLVEVASPDGGTTRYAYDEADRLTLKRMPAGAAIRYRYDAAGRIGEVLRPEGPVRVEYAPHGRPTRIAYPEGEERFAYDAAARLTEHVRLIDGHRFITAYRYDARGQLVEKRLPDGQRLVYEYRGPLHPRAGTLAAVYRDDGQGRTPLATGLNDPDDRYADRSFLLANGLPYVTRLDVEGQVRRIGTPGVAELGFAFDADAKAPTPRLGDEADRVTQRVRYDAAGRLAALTAPHHAFRATFDATGNPLEAVRDGVLTRYEIDPLSNRILAERSAAAKDRAGRVTYRYDAAGSVVERGRDRFEYDSEAPPIRFYRDGVLVAEYRYNAFGERIKKIVHAPDGERVTYFFHDGAQLTAEADAAGTITAQYVWLDAQPIAKLEGKAVYAIHADQRGAPLAATDAQRRIVWRADTTAWGKATVTTHAIALNLRASNQYYDAETGLHDNLHRLYDPDSGRYLSADPSGLAGGMNLYAFADGDPIRKADPLGLQAKPVADEDISGLSFGEKLTIVLKQAAPRVPGLLGEALLEMVQPDQIAYTTAIFALWVSSHAIGIGVGVDVVLGGLAFAMTGMAGVELVLDLIKAVNGIDDATCRSHLEEPTGIVAAAVANFGGRIGGGKKSRDALRKIVDESKALAKKSGIRPPLGKRLGYLPEDFRKFTRVVIGRAERAGILRRTGSGEWTSTGGLVYERDPTAELGSRVGHLLKHGFVDPDRPGHTVFAVDDPLDIIRLADKAYLGRTGEGRLGGGPRPVRIWTIAMGRVIGTRGEEFIELVLDARTGKFVSAFPVVKPRYPDSF